MTKIWLVWANSDNIEGRGRDEVKYICATEELANKMAQGLGPMGCSNGRVTMSYVLEQVEDAQKQHQQELMQRALAKLSDEEKRALKLI